MYLQIQFQQVADASDPRICICKFISNKLQMLPTPTRHLQIQFQQIADASNPGQASANPIPASCRCFHVRSSPLYVSANPIPTSCRCFRPQDMYLQIHIQQIADDSNPDQASTNPIPANCRCFQPRPGICKSNSNKLQMLPTPTRHLQIQFQQIADASNPGQASANPIPASCRCFHVRSSPLYVSANPIPASCRCFRP